MKIRVLCLGLLFIFLASACSNKNSNEIKKNYGKEIKISPMDFVKIDKDTITIEPSEENQTYTISGYFYGQIISNTKNTVIKLDNVYLENHAGKAALKCTAKTEVSTLSETTNYIVTHGRGFNQSGALQGRKGIVLGGSGTLNVFSGLCHAVEAESVKIKGSGSFYLEGTKRGSCINCETFTVEEGKTFTAYLLNAKNGIKADTGITINSGRFYFTNNNVGLKTDLSKDSENKTHYIKLAGGEFHSSQVDQFYITDEDSYFAENAIFMED
ncbi:MAG: carbohydrate-binding domain-containing protein [Treponema sp.]|nr:carbohydrate-binding domain-containing protein [Treponema sp.]